MNFRTQPDLNQLSQCTDPKSRQMLIAQTWGCPRLRDAVERSRSGLGRSESETLITQALIDQGGNINEIPELVKTWRSLQG